MNWDVSLTSSLWLLYQRSCLAASSFGVRVSKRRMISIPWDVEVAQATTHVLLNAKVNNGRRHACTIILIISCCPQAVITYTPYFPNVPNLFLMSRIISYVKVLPTATNHASSFRQPQTRWPVLGQDCRSHTVSHGTGWLEHALIPT